MAKAWSLNEIAKHNVARSVCAPNAFFGDQLSKEITDALERMAAIAGSS